MQKLVDWVVTLFFSILTWIAHMRIIMRNEPINAKIWVKDEIIELWVDGLIGLPVPYNDCEMVRKHPFLLRLRLWLAKRRIYRRNIKLTKFYLNQIAGQ